MKLPAWSRAVNAVSARSEQDVKRRLDSGYPCNVVARGLGCGTNHVFLQGSLRSFQFHPELYRQRRRRGTAQRDQRPLLGAQPSSARLKTFSFTQLPAERDGWSFWCRDCALTNPCAGNGPGATPRGESGRYNCAASAVDSGPVTATTLTGSAAGDGSNSINRMNWDSILTPSTFATTSQPFRKARVDQHVFVVSHGGTTVTDANGLWTSADVGSLINLYWGYIPRGDGKWAYIGLSAAATVFTGCIAAVNSPGQITLGNIRSGVCSTVGVSYSGPTMTGGIFAATPSGGRMPLPRSTELLPAWGIPP